MKFAAHSTGNPVGKIKHIAPESAAVIATGDILTRDATTSDLEQAVAASTEVCIAMGPSAAGSVDPIPVAYGDEWVFKATADANYAGVNGGAVDITNAGLVDLGASATDVLTVVDGVVGTTTVYVKLNKSILA